MYEGVKDYGRERSMKSAMDLYRELKSGNMYQEKLTSILPDEVVKDIQRDCLHVFLMPPGHAAFRSGEKLYLAEHACFYFESDNGFDVQCGVLYLTGERIVFCCEDGDISVPYSEIVWITKYDDIPQILEIQKNDGSLIVRVPDAGIADRCIHMIRDHDYTKVIGNEPFSYEKLIEGADQDVLIFAFEYTLGKSLPEGVRYNLGEIAGKLSRLRDVLKKYPEYAEDTVRFLDQLVPAAVYVIMAYREHYNTGPDVKKGELSGRSSSAETDGTNDREMNRLNDRVFEATKALNDALQSKLTEICKEAADRTLAQADALRSGIELESLRQGEIRLVF